MIHGLKQQQQHYKDFHIKPKQTSLNAIINYF